MTLQRLLKLQLHRYVDEVSEVVDRALKEHSMELTIDKLEATWAAVEFLFDEHAPGSVVSAILAIYRRIHIYTYVYVRVNPLTRPGRRSSFCSTSTRPAPW